MATDPTTLHPDSDSSMTADAHPDSIGDALGSTTDGRDGIEGASHPPIEDTPPPEDQPMPAEDQPMPDETGPVPNGAPGTIMPPD